MHKSFVFHLLIFKQCYWIIPRYTKIHCSVTVRILHKAEQKDRTKTLAELPDHILNDYDTIETLEQALKYVCRQAKCPMTLFDRMTEFESDISSLCMTKGLWNVRSVTTDFISTLVNIFNNIVYNTVRPQQNSDRFTQHMTSPKLRLKRISFFPKKYQK